MSITTIANRYSRALADVVFAKGEHTLVQQEMAAFVGMFNENPELREVFSNPTISLQDQRSVLTALIERTRPSQTTSNFLQVLLQNYRLQYLPEVNQAFARIIDERMNIVSAEITTAAPIAAEQQELLNNQLRKVTGKDVRLKFSTDPTIIGGVVTQIGSTIYDGSIRNQLGLLRTQLSRE